MTPGTYVMRNASKKRVAEKYRTIVVGEDGRLFVHPALAGRQDHVLMCAIADSVGMMITKGRTGSTYVPADWMEKVYPETQEFITRIRETEVEDDN